MLQFFSIVYIYHFYEKSHFLKNSETTLDYASETNS